MRTQSFFAVGKTAYLYPSVHRSYCIILKWRTFSSKKFYICRNSVLLVLAFIGTDTWSNILHCFISLINMKVIKKFKGYFIRLWLYHGMLTETLENLCSLREFDENWERRVGHFGKVRMRSHRKEHDTGKVAI